MRQSAISGRKFVLCLLCLIGGIAVLLALKTVRDLQPLPALSCSATRGKEAPASRPKRQSAAISYQNRWSVQTVALHEIPPLAAKCVYRIRGQAFSSPRRGGLAGPRARTGSKPAGHERGAGASTITEQVVRMLHPRPRTVWSRWLEGIEAARLEKRFSKSEILEFYLNQVPYGHQRRGVVEAARFYFDRDPATLNAKESLALAVLVRAPSGLDLKQQLESLESASVEARSTYARQGPAE